MTTHHALSIRCANLPAVDMFTFPLIKKVSVVIPVFNEQESLPALIQRTVAACETLSKDYEIVWLMMAAMTTQRG